MPASLSTASPSGVMPYALSTAFSEARKYEQLQTPPYNDGTIQRSQLAQTSRRTFGMSQRLSAAKMSALKSFWDGQNGGQVPFFFYNLVEGAWDGTGTSTTGRYTVVFRGTWTQQTGLGRSSVPQIQLEEVA